MRRTSRKTRGKSSPGAARRELRIVRSEEVLQGRVAVELPVSPAEVIEGVGEEIERPVGAAGMLIMRAVMNAEIESLTGPQGQT